jgi:MYXO-CTERM domain-containing protein
MHRHARIRAISRRAPLALVLLVGLPATPARAQPPSAEDEAKSRELYQQAEQAANVGDWQQAADKYEQAYYLLPSKHGFAYKIGMAAWEAKDCVRAEKYLTHFRTYGSGDKHPEYMTEADRVLNEIEFKGCAEAPSEPAEGESSKRGCALTQTPPAGLGLLVLLAIARRRIKRERSSARRDVRRVRCRSAAAARSSARGR